MTRAFSLASTYIHLKTDESAVTLEGGDAFWAGIAGRTDLDVGRLMGTTPQTADWPHWERHPAGEEILVLLSGELELVLDPDDGAERRVILGAGQTFIVPRGVWHRGIVRQPGVLMFITPGAGTDHRPLSL